MLLSFGLATSGIYMDAVKGGKRCLKNILVKLPLLQFGLHVADVMCRLFLLWGYCMRENLCRALMQVFRSS